MNKHILMLSLAIVALLFRTAIGQESTMPQFPSRMIWNGAKHCAFTDVIQFKGKFYCTFRESSVGHIPGKTTGEGDGVVRVLCSLDGEKWESVALLQRKTFDLRDAKLSETPDGRLMVLMGGSVYVDQKLVKRIVQVSFSDENGQNFSAPKNVEIDPAIRSDLDWLWRVTWHEGVGYGVVYQPITSDWKIFLVKTTDGVHYQNVTQLDVPGRPNEATVRFTPTGEMQMLIRREAGDCGAYFGTAKAPFTDWTFVNCGTSLGGPNFIYLPDGRILAGGRVNGKTGIGFLEKDGHFKLYSILPSAGDNSYPGFTIRDGKVYVTYYSSHEGNTAIYLSVIPLEEPIAIDCDFPGGNIIVDSIQDGEARVRPDLRDTKGEWFYFAFRVRNAQGQKIRFDFQKANRVGSRGPAVSIDGGKTWFYTVKEPNHSDREFTYQFGADEKSVLFALAPLYTQNNWEEFKEKIKDRPGVNFTTLCKSRKGRDVELLRIGEGNPNAKFALVLTCRHHCCEMTASWAVEGMITEILSGSEAGNWLLANAEIFVVPFIDKDGVEDGDQGKNRKPHDHNRDYNHRLYPEIKSLEEQIQENFKDKKIVFFDNHCPWIRSGMNEYLYSPMGSNPKMTAACEEYFKIFEKYQKSGEIPYKVQNNLPFGKDWNTEKNYFKYENGILTTSSKTWVGSLPNTILAGTIELPYSNASNVEVTPDNARELGANMVKAFAEFMQQHDL